MNPITGSGGHSLCVTVRVNVLDKGLTTVFLGTEKLLHEWVRVRKRIERTFSSENPGADFGLLITR